MNFNLYKITKNKIDLKGVRYEFGFLTYFSLNNFFNFKLLFNKITKNKVKKIIIKQSYFFFIWLYYLKFVNKKISLKYKIFLVPTNKKLITIIKSPMARKTFSQEQFTIKFFKLKISFGFKHKNKSIDVNNSFYVLLIFLQNFPIFETNILWLQKINYFIHIYDKRFYLI